jgi:FkbM family methyltransferase
MHHHIGPGDCVWDVGAEEGDFPALWASWGASVVLAEPNPLVWPNIKAIFEANHLPEPEATWVGFLGPVQHTGTMPATSGWPACADGALIGDHGFCQYGERPDLPATTIDHLVHVGVTPPSVITMDVEGSELHVLRGAEATIEQHRPLLFVSIHPEFMEHHYGLTEGVRMVRNLMADHGYAETFLAIDHEHHWMFTP